MRVIKNILIIISMPLILMLAFMKAIYDVTHEQDNNTGSQI